MTIKQIFIYVTWIVIALFLGVIYVLLLLGLPQNEFTGVLHLIDIFLNLGAFYLSLIIGSIIAVLFLLLDVFYLKKKLNNDFKSMVIRVVVILGITIIVGIVHYVLEKQIDII
jgi:hypothetical protein